MNEIVMIEASLTLILRDKSLYTWLSTWVLNYKDRRTILSLIAVCSWFKRIFCETRWAFLCLICTNSDRHIFRCYNKIVLSKIKCHRKVTGCCFGFDWTNECKLLLYYSNININPLSFLKWNLTQHQYTLL